jgi:hypothetical protein
MKNDVGTEHFFLVLHSFTSFPEVHLFFVFLKRELLETVLEQIPGDCNLKNEEEATFLPGYHSFINSFICVENRAA